MTIKVGDRLPDVKFTVMGSDGPTPKTVKDVFSGKKVALFAVPGAYTPACDKNHMPGFVSRVGELKAKGIPASLSPKNQDQKPVRQATVADPIPSRGITLSSTAVLSNSEVSPASG